MNLSLFNPINNKYPDKMRHCAIFIIITLRNSEIKNNMIKEN